MDTPEKTARFDDQMLRRERILGFVWLPIHVIALPLLLGVVLMLVTGKLPDEAQMNTIYYIISFAFIVLAVWSFLKLGYRRLVERFRAVVLMMFLAYLLQVGLSLLVNLGSGVFGELETPNNDAINDLTKTNLKQIIAIAVLMAPIVEEVLFRGVLFGTIAKKSRVAAYAASIILFSLYHVWQFAVVEGDWSVLVNAIAYVPLSAALTFCYDRTETIWAPIFFHILVNTLALTVMTAM